MILNWLKYELPLGLLLIVPASVFLQTTGDISEYFRYQVPDGQICYLASKLCGLYAMVFLWLQLLQGLLNACGHWFLNRSGNPRFHRNLGLCVVSLFVSHITFFVMAVSLRNGYFDYGPLLPNFSGSYYPTILSLGVLGAWLLLITMIVAIAHRQLGGKAWIWGHRLSWIAFFLVFFHSYLIGSETRVGMMESLYYFMLASVVTAIAYRIWKGFAQQRGSVSDV